MSDEVVMDGETTRFLDLLKHPDQPVEASDYFAGLNATILYLVAENRWLRQELRAVSDDLRDLLESFE